MADDPTPPKGRTDVIVGLHERDAERDAEDRREDRAERRAREEREAKDRADERAASQKTIRAWQITAGLLIFVLLVLVSGIVGVGVSGHVPGLGDIKITQPRAAATKPAPRDTDGPVEELR